LAALQGVDIALAATSVGLDPILIERVDNGRQGFPKSYARNLAAALGVDEPTLLAAARTVLDDSAYPQSMASVAIAPKPPEAILGETFPMCLTNVTRNQSTVMAPALTVWLVGQDVGNVGSKGAFGRINRNTGVPLAPIEMSNNVQMPMTLTRGIDTLYTSGDVSELGNPRVAAVSLLSGTITHESLIGTTNNTCTVTYAPATNELWVSVQLDERVYVLDVVTGGVLYSLALTYLGNDYEPCGMVAANGKMYVTGARNLGGGSWEGHLFEFNQTTYAIERVSTGDNMGTCVDVAFDGVDTFYVVSSIVAGGGFFVVPTSSFSSSARSFSGLELIYDAKWVVCAFGFVFVSEQNIGSIPKLIRVTPGSGLQLAATFLSFGGSGYLGKPGFDSLLLWVPNPNDGTVSMVKPDTMTVMTSVFVDGQPWAAIVV
jgi:hypothetical protein